MRIFMFYAFGPLVKKRCRQTRRHEKQAKGKEKHREKERKYSQAMQMMMAPYCLKHECWTSSNDKNEETENKKKQHRTKSNQCKSCSRHHAIHATKTQT